MFLRKAVLKIRSKFTGEHPCQSAISIKLQSNFIEIALRHGCSAVNLLHIFRTAFPKKISGWQLLYLKPCQTSKIFFLRQKAERFCRKPPIIFEKSCILNSWRSSGYNSGIGKVPNYWTIYIVILTLSQWFYKISRYLHPCTPHMTQSKNLLIPDSFFE